MANHPGFVGKMRTETFTTFTRERVENKAMF